MVLLLSFPSVPEAFSVTLKYAWEFRKSIDNLEFQVKFQLLVHLKVLKHFHFSFLHFSWFYVLFFLGVDYSYLLKKDFQSLLDRERCRFRSADLIRDKVCTFYRCKIFSWYQLRNYWLLALNFNVISKTALQWLKVRSFLAHQYKT